MPVEKGRRIGGEEGGVRKTAVVPGDGLPRGWR